MKVKKGDLLVKIDDLELQAQRWQQGIRAADEALKLKPADPAAVATLLDAAAYTQLVA